MTQRSHAIQNLDLDAVITCLQQEKHMTAQELETAVREYQQFLTLKMLHGVNHAMAPTPAADLVWHYHILDTRKYMADCQALFGEYLHHNPQPSDNVMALAAARSQKHWKETFGNTAPKSVASAICC